MINKNGVFRSQKKAKFWSFLALNVLMKTMKSDENGRLGHLNGPVKNGPFGSIYTDVLFDVL